MLLRACWSSFGFYEVVLGPEDHGTETGMLSVDSLGGDSILHRLNLRDSEVHLPPARQLKWWKKSRTYSIINCPYMSPPFCFSISTFGRLLRSTYWNRFVLSRWVFTITILYPSVLQSLGFAATHSEVIFAADLESGTFVKMDRSVNQLYAWVFHAWVYGRRLAGMMILCDFLWFYLISVSSNFYLLLYGMDSQGVCQANSSDLDPPIMSSKFETLVSSYFCRSKFC